MTFETVLNIQKYNLFAFAPSPMSAVAKKVDNPEDMLMLNHTQAKKDRFIGVGFYHWYTRLAEQISLLPKITFRHDPDAVSRGRVVSDSEPKVLPHGWDVYIP